MEWKRRYGRRPVVFVFLFLSLWLAGLTNAQPVKTTARWDTRVVSNINAWDLNEISGMAASRVRDDILWVHNDSGDKARVYAVHTNGTLLGHLELIGVRAKDWEDMASGTLGGTNLLALGDIGDNGSRRKEIVVHLVVEPTLPARPDGTSKQAGSKPWARSVAPLRTLRLVYPDGPRDAESLALDIKNRQLLILSKRDKRPRLYSAPLAPRPAGQPRVLTFRAELPLPLWPSGLDLDAANRRLVVSTLNQLYLFERGPAEPWPAAFVRGPEVVPRPVLRQAESVCFARGGVGIWSGSEKSPSPLLLSSRRPH